jgi:hypothetical protein
MNDQNEAAKRAELDEEEENDDSPVSKKVDPHKTLFVTDAELIRRMGVPEKVMRPVLRHFDDKPQLGFPKKQALFGNRRYWPAVKAYLDRPAGLTPQPSLTRR